MNIKRKLLFSLVIITFLSILINSEIPLDNTTGESHFNDKFGTEIQFNNNFYIDYNNNFMILNLLTPSEDIKQGQFSLNSKWRLSGIAGAPQIPIRYYKILLPPNTDPYSVKIDIIQDTPIYIDGEYTYQPGPFPAISINDDMIISHSEDVSNVYKEDAFWPNDIIQSFSISQMRDAVITEFSFYPYQYNPITKRLVEHRDVKISINWDKGNKEKVDPLTEKFLSDLGMNIYNLVEILPLYSQGSSNEIPNSTYVIITTENTESNSEKLDDFVRYKQASGFNVKIITEDEYGSAIGRQRVLNIRNWLQNNYQSDNIEYVLLIGNPDPDDEENGFDSVGDIPMLMCWPRYGSSTYRNSPTDYIYADLTGNWNLDGDNFYGEFNGDRGIGGVDFAPEVYVGRIPVYNSNYTALDIILQSIIDHHINAGAEKNKIIIPMAISNYENEDYSGWDRTDGLDCPEDVYNNILNPIGMTDTVMYERSGIDPVPISAFHYAMPLNRTNFISEFNQGYGAVFWWGHGSSTGAFRMYWSSDDGDGVPESSEMTWTTFLNSNDMPQLDNDQPAFFYQSSCTNGEPENSNNLGYALLKRGAAVSTVSASRVSWYLIGNWNYTQWWDAYADNTGIGYYYMENLLKNNMSAGEALYTAKSSGGSGLYSGSWMNKMDFNLYGDPQLNYWGSNQPNAPTNPSPANETTWVNNNPTLSVDVSDPDGDSMTVVFYNASNNNLIGYDSNVTNGGTASVTWSGLYGNQTYSWYVIVGDGQLIKQSLNWSFSTGHDPTWEPVPTDQFAEYGYPFNYDLNAYDSAGIDYYWINDTTYFSINATSGLISNSTPLSIDEYWLEVRAYDTLGYNCSANIKITVNDTTGPVWDQIPTDQVVEFGDFFSYDVNSFDPSGVDYYWINDTTYFSINATSGLITNSTPLSIDEYWLEVRAYDTLGYNCSANIKITVNDSTNPTWDQLPANQTVEFGDFFSYNVNSSDLSGIYNYWVSDMVNFTIDSNGLLTNATVLSVGDYELEIRAYDQYGNYCTATITVTVGSEERRKIPGFDFILVMMIIVLFLSLSKIKSRNYSDKDLT
ncbi:MAG: C25 family cysteine peptidase [Promethearchaeota archaeon]